MLCIHVDDQDEFVQYWRIVIPDDFDIKKEIIKECHNIPYVNHPGV